MCTHLKSIRYRCGHLPQHRAVRGTPASHNRPCRSPARLRGWYAPAMHRPSIPSRRPRVRLARLTMLVLALCAIGTGAPLPAQTTTSGAVSPLFGGGGGCLTGAHTTVTPCGGNASAFTNATGQLVTFTLQNTDPSGESYDLSCSYTAPVTSCSVSSFIDFPNGSGSQSVRVTYATAATAGTGSVTLTALSSVTGDEAKGEFHVAVSYPTMTVTTAFNTNDNQDLSRCAASCFAVTEAIASVPYFSLGQPHAVRLVYNSDRAAPRPFVFLDVAAPSGANAPDTLTLQLQDSAGAFYPFVNGDTTLRFLANPAGQTVRLPAQIDARTKATGYYRVNAIVTAVYPTHRETQTLPLHLLIENEASSPFGKGWMVAGLERLYLEPDSSAVLTAGDGSALYFGHVAGTCYTSPPGDFSCLRVTGTGFERSYPDSTTIAFDHTGRVTSLTDRFGITDSVAYDASGRPWKLYDPIRKDPSGQLAYRLLTYTASGFLARILSPGPTGDTTGGRATTITIGADSLLTQAEDPDGDSTRFGYDADQRLTSVIDRRGDTTSYVYDSTSWKLAQVLAPTVPIDAGNGTTTLKRPTTTYAAWQAVGEPRGRTSGSGAAPAPWMLADTAEGVVTDPGGHATRFTVNRWGAPRTSVDPLGATTEVTYASDGRPIRTQYPAGTVDTVVYSGPFIAAGQKTGQAWTTYDYGVDGQLQNVYQNGIDVTHYQLGPRGEVTSAEAGDVSHTTSFTYDSLGRVLTRTDPQGHRTTFHYEATFGQVDTTVAPGNLVSVTSYDGFGRDTAVKVNQLPARRTHYDVLNRKIAVYDGVHGSPLTFSYDALYLTRVQDQKDQVYRWTVNALGWKTADCDAADTTLAATYRYDVDGLLTSTTNRRGQRLGLAYDVGHRLTARTDAAGAVLTRYGYTATGSIGADSNAVAVDSTFSTPGLHVDSVVTHLGGQRFKTGYSYDSYGRLRGIGFPRDTDPDRPIVRFAPRAYYYNDTTGVLDSILVGGSAVRYYYNKDRLPIGATWFPHHFVVGDSEANAYSSEHKQTLLSVSTPGSGATVTWRGVGSDSLGHVVAVFRDSASTKLRQYAYDGLGQLDSVRFLTASAVCAQPDTNYGYRCPGLATTLLATTAYHYDAVGNDTTGGASYTTGNRLVSWPGGVSFGYDADGNRVWKVTPTDSTSYVWSAEGQLAEVRTRSGRHLGYHYDAAGRLVERTVFANDSTEVPDRYFLWAGGQLLAELSATATRRVGEYAYGPGVDVPIALVTGDTTATEVRYLIQDQLGNVAALIDSTNHSAGEFLYDAWGRMDTTSVNSGLADTVRLRWKALLWEGDSTKLYYVRTRWYDPATHRFLAEDPIGLAGGKNPYVFAGNNPIGMRDPSGLLGDDVDGIHSRQCLDPGEFDCHPGTDVQGVADDPFGDIAENEREAAAEAAQEQMKAWQAALDKAMAAISDAIAGQVDAELAQLDATQQGGSDSWSGSEGSPSGYTIVYNEAKLGPKTDTNHNFPIQLDHWVIEDGWRSRGYNPRMTMYEISGFHYHSQPEKSYFEIGLFQVGGYWQPGNVFVVTHRLFKPTIHVPWF